MRWSRILLSTALAVATPLVPAADNALKELLACHDAAVGGEKLRSRQTVRYQLRIVEPEFQVDAVYLADRRGRARIDVYAGAQRVFTESWTGTRAWQLPQGAEVPEPVSADGAAALRHGVEQPGHLWTLADMDANGHRVAWVGDETRDGTAYQVVKLTLADGATKWYWLDAGTCRIARERSFRAFHPDVDPEKRWIETVHDEFGEQDGIVRPIASRQLDLATGETIGTARVVFVEYDPELPPHPFDPFEP